MRRDQVSMPSSVTVTTPSRRRLVVIAVVVVVIVMLFAVMLLAWQRLIESLTGDFECELLAADGDVELEHGRQATFVDFDRLARLIVDRAARCDAHRLVDEDRDELCH